MLLVELQEDVVGLEHAFGLSLRSNGVDRQAEAAGNVEMRSQGRVHRAGGDPEVAILSEGEPRQEEAECERDG